MKNKKSSVLVVTLIVLGIMLTTALSIALVSTKERRASMSTSKTGVVFQTADAGIEKVMQRINSGKLATVDEIDDDPATKIDCDGGVLKDINGQFTVVIQDSNGDDIDCDDPSIKMQDVIKIKAISTSSTQVARAIEAYVDPCIKSCEALQNLNTIPGGPKGNFCLSKDIDCSGVNFIPIAGFSGTFDGRGFKVFNLEIDVNSDAGLFDKLSADNTQIISLGVSTSPSVKSSSDNVGILAGAISGKVTIENCYSEGKVEGKNNIGGLVGSLGSDGSINQSYSLANVISSGNNSGGLIGKNDGNVIDSFSVGDIDGDAVCGGFVGENSKDISKSYSSGEVNCSNLPAGSFGGKNSGDIEDSYAKENVAMAACGSGVLDCDATLLDGDEMEDDDSFVGFDFSNIPIWQIDKGDSYPCFPWMGGTDQCPPTP